MSAANMGGVSGARKIQPSRSEGAVLSPARIGIFVLPNRWSGASNAGVVCDFRPLISFNCPAFVPPPEARSDRGRSTTKTFTHSEKLTQLNLKRN